ncbi:PAS domain S-box protein [Chondrinema litorale]|uniref:PAS domain S-box protein n=1 Tax=Chondrinema litorale TaxID=2994555 RepID=UPI0025433B97|nr:PAS domain S-box protein [Chondrinema litorale]UZR93059.1 PAS domain S-box protein [Chondrinema litorale]
MLSSTSKIFSFGITEDNTDYQNDNIKISNQIAFYHILSAILVSIYFAINFPKLLFLSIIPLGISIITLVLSYLYLTKASRFLSSVFPCLYVAIIHGLIVETGDAPRAGTFGIELATATIPFLLFDFREKKYLISSIASCFVILASYQLRIDYISLNTELFINTDHPQMFKLAMLVATLQLFLEVFILKYSHYKSELKNEATVKQAYEQNIRLKKSEEILLESLKTLDDSKEAEQRRLWITEGATKLAKILRSIDNSQELFDKILSELIKYLQANQGAFYVVEQDEETDPVKIKLVSSYAYDRKKFNQQEFEPGEGLLGQCYFEKNIIKLTEIPEDYVDITSGLGEATPRTLIIIPLKLNEQIAGFVEIASFEEMDEYKISFLERVSENIASTIINNKIHEKTTQLLTKSQEQAHAMRTQEEEMRQNFEELQTTQEEMERVQNELRYMKDHLEHELASKIQQLEQYKNNIEVFMNSSSDSILYTQTDGKIIMCNPRVEKMFGFTSEEVLDMGINELFDNEKDLLITDCFDSLKNEESKFFYDFSGKSKLYGYNFPVEIKIGKGNDESNDIFSIMVRDISKQKKREESMKKSIASISKLQQSLMQKQQEINSIRKELKEKDKEITNLKSNQA